MSTVNTPAKSPLRPMEKSNSSATNLPECWSDDVRMDVLFAPFRLRKVNPENYEAKLKFWKDMIVRHCEQKGCPCFSVREIRWAYERKNKLPHGIEIVVDDLNANKELRLHADFVNDPQNTWSGWLVNGLMRKPLQWGFQKFRDPVEPNDVLYVHLDVLKNQSKNLKRILDKFAGTVVAFDKIADTDGLDLSKDGLYLNLLYLSSLQKVFLEYQFKDEERRVYLVKVPDKHSPATPITEADKAVYALEQTEVDLLRTIEEIETEVVKCDQLARENVRQGKRIVAKTYLRKKHKLESSLVKHSKALDNVQTMLASIHDTRGNELILDAYKIGSKTLKSLLTTPDTDLDNIDEVVDNIKESLEIHDEVQQTMSAVQTTDPAEESALEKELAELMEDKAFTSVKPEQPENIYKPPAGGNVQANDSIVVVNSKVTANHDDLLKYLDELQIEAGNLSTHSDDVQNVNL